MKRCHLQTLVFLGWVSIIMFLIVPSVTTANPLKGLFMMMKSQPNHGESVTTNESRQDSECAATPGALDVAQKRILELETSLKDKEAAHRVSIAEIEHWKSNGEAYQNQQSIGQGRIAELEASLRDSQEALAAALGKLDQSNNEMEKLQEQLQNGGVDDELVESQRAALVLKDRTIQHLQEELNVKTQEQEKVSQARIREIEQQWKMMQQDSEANMKKVLAVKDEEYGTKLEMQQQMCQDETNQQLENVTIEWKQKYTDLEMRLQEVQAEGDKALALALKESDDHIFEQEKVHLETKSNLERRQQQAEREISALVAKNSKLNETARELSAKLHEASQEIAYWKSLFDARPYFNATYVWEDVTKKIYTLMNSFTPYSDTLSALYEAHIQLYVKKLRLWYAAYASQHITPVLLKSYKMIQQSVVETRNILTKFSVAAKAFYDEYLHVYVHKLRLWYSIYASQYVTRWLGIITDTIRASAIGARNVAVVYCETLLALYQAHIYPYVNKPRRWHTMYVSISRRIDEINHMALDCWIGARRLVMDYSDSLFVMCGFHFNDYEPIPPFLNRANAMVQDLVIGARSSAAASLAKLFISFPEYCAFITLQFQRLPVFSGLEVSDYSTDHFCKHPEQYVNFYLKIMVCLMILTLFAHHSFFRNLLAVILGYTTVTNAKETVPVARPADGRNPPGDDKQLKLLRQEKTIPLAIRSDAIVPSQVYSVNLSEDKLIELIREHCRPLENDQKESRVSNVLDDNNSIELVIRIYPVSQYHLKPNGSYH